MQNSKQYFIITIDTEGDNLWMWKNGMPITTENVNYLPRFQALCNQYGFIPTWLCDWEMTNDPNLVSFLSKHLVNHNCEVGMHLHAWNTPPEYEFASGESCGSPYLIEYPEAIMSEKIAQMTQLIEDRFSIKPVVHRAGRWAMNKSYFQLLKNAGYLVDCSITPTVNWEGSIGQTPGFKGPNYREEKAGISNREGIIEVPVSTLWSNKMFIRAHFSCEGIKKELQRGKTGRTLWLRPTGRNLHEMLYLIDQKWKSSAENYLMFMLHSSELMPGGSPNFKTAESIENLYRHLEIIFGKIAKLYQGVGLEEYAKIMIQDEIGTSRLMD